MRFLVLLAFVRYWSSDRIQRQIPRFARDDDVFYSRNNMARHFKNALFYSDDGAPSLLLKQAASERR
jgi:hypothetical protein